MSPIALTEDEYYSKDQARETLDMEPTVSTILKRSLESAYLRNLKKTHRPFSKESLSAPQVDGLSRPSSLIRK
ncbi:hypothetical protein ACW18Z_03585, partial [Limosilactobacillus fermentum]